MNLTSLLWEINEPINEPVYFDRHSSNLVITTREVFVICLNTAILRWMVDCIVE